MKLGRVSLAIAIAVAVLAYSAYWHILLPRNDEGYIAPFAWRMLTGAHLPYVDAVSHRGPLTYDLAFVSTAIFGPGALAMRALSLFLTSITAVLIFLSSDNEEEGGIAALVYVLVVAVVMEPFYQAEHALNAVALGAFAILSKDRKNTAFALAAGALAACPVLAKQTGAFVPLAMAAWLAASARERPWPLVAYVLGTVLAPAIYIVRYAAHGELATFRYYFLTYNSSVYMAPFTRRMVFEEIGSFLWGNALWLIIAALAITWGFWSVFRGAKRSEIASRWDARATIALCALASLVASHSTLRSFYHYYIPIVPWFALLGTSAAFSAVRWLEARGHKSSRRLFLAAFFAFAVLRVGVREWTLPTRAKDPPAWTKPAALPLCDLVRAHSKDGDAIFIWGFRPWYYIDCNRRPASRFVQTTFVMGFVPWFDEPYEVEQTRVTPHAHELLLADLEKSKPAIVVDAPIGWRHMNRYPDLAAFLQRSYCFLEEVDDPSSPLEPMKLGVYVRVRDDGKCPI